MFTIVITKNMFSLHDCIPHLTSSTKLPEDGLRHHQQVNFCSCPTATDFWHRQHPADFCNLFLAVFFILPNISESNRCILMDVLVFSIVTSWKIHDNVHSFTPLIVSANDERYQQVCSYTPESSDAHDLVVKI